MSVMKLPSPMLEHAWLQPGAGSLVVFVSELPLLRFL